MSRYLLTADWHLRDDVPECRLDGASYFETQLQKVKWILDFAGKKKATILHAGDFFHSWKPSLYLINRVLALVSGYSEKIYIIPGNHDLPHHNEKELDHSGLGLLFRQDGLIRQGEREISIIMAHQYVYASGEDAKQWEKDAGCSALSFLKKKQKEGFDFVLTGDNHQSFIVRYGEGALINPGSLMRMTADQVSHRPRVYLWDAGEITEHFIPIQKDVVSREHIERRAKREADISSFVKRLREDVELDLSFVKNLERFCKKNKVSEEVREILYTAMERQNEV